MSTYTKIAERLEKLGVEYNSTMINGEARITSITIPWAPEVWFEVCTREGSFYIGGCCANSSTTQDIVNAAFRDSGELHASSIRRLLELGSAHDGQNSLWGDAPIPEKLPPSSDPWGMLACLCRIVEPGLTLLSYENSVRLRAEYPLEHEFTTLDRLLFRYRWHSLTTKNTPSDDAQMLRLIARIWAGLKPVYEHMQGRIAPAPVSGFVVATPNGIVSRELYQTKEEAATALEEIRVYLRSEHRRNVLNELEEEALCVRPVHVNVTDGLVFTDTNEHYDFE